MQSKVISLTRLNAHFLMLRLQKPPGFTFQAGQHVSLLVNSIGHRRSYSLASSPYAHHLDLLVELILHGMGSTYVLSLKPNDTVQILGPMGNFILTDITHSLYLAAGSGIAPFLAIKPKHLVWSVKKTHFFDTGLNPLVFHSRQELTNYLISHISYPNFYLCGSIPYVTSLTKFLLSQGVNSNNLHTEKFV